MVKTIRPTIIRRFSRISLPLALMLPLFFLTAVNMAGFLILAHAAEPPTLGEALSELLGALKDKATTAVILVFVFQILRTHEFLGILGKLGVQGKLLQVAIAVITALGFVAEAWGRGAPIGQALIEGLFTAGGMMLIFDAIRSTSPPKPTNILPLGD